MHFNKNNGCQLLLYSMLFVMLVLSGCAQKQWTGPLEEDQEKAAQQLLAAMKEKQSSCSKSMDAEINATWKSRISDGGITGYLQLLRPSTVKLVIINPLGQTLYAFTTDGRKFQTINVQDHLFKYGRVATFVEKHSLPKGILHDGWGRWLTGEMPFNKGETQELFQDKSLRGFWFTVEPQEGASTSKEYLLINPGSRRLLERVAMDNDGNEIARVLYKSWINKGSCDLPSSLEIQSPAYGTTINIEMKDIKSDKVFAKNDLFLRPPRGYLQEYYP